MTHQSNLEAALLAALRQNGRESVSSLADKLGVSRVTVTKMMHRLEANGTILGYTVKLGEEQSNDQVRAITFIEVERTNNRNVINQLKLIPEISSIHTTNGAWDLVIEVSCRSLKDFDHVLGRIRSFTGVVSSESSLLLTTVRL